MDDITIKGKGSFVRINYVSSYLFLMFINIGYFYSYILNFKMEIYKKIYCGIGLIIVDLTLISAIKWVKNIKIIFKKDRLVLSALVPVLNKKRMVTIFSIGKRKIRIK